VPTKERTDPGQQLGQAEGLGDVVVGAGVEPDHQVHLVGPGRQDQDRNGAAVRADAPADLKTVNVRQAEVEHDHVGIFVGTL